MEDTESKNSSIASPESHHSFMMKENDDEDGNWVGSDGSPISDVMRGLELGNRDLAEDERWL